MSSSLMATARRLSGTAKAFGFCRGMARISQGSTHCWCGVSMTRLPRILLSMVNWLRSTTLVFRASMLSRMQRPKQVSFSFAFDVLVSEGKDVKTLPLRTRKELLSRILQANGHVQLSEHFGGPLAKFIEGVKRIGGEGVIAKRLDAPYQPGRRSGSWSKKRINIGQEFVIGGFTPGTNGIDALVVGYYEDGLLVYAARVRAGLVPASRRVLYGILKPHIVKTCPFANLPEVTSGRWGQGLTAAKMKECIWVRPRFVAKFEFLEWTDSNHVRHIKFVALRSDKDPLTVVRE